MRPVSNLLISLLESQIQMQVAGRQAVARAEKAWPGILARQVVGPRLPLAWFQGLADEAKDWEPCAERWHAPDLHHCPG